MKFNFNTRKKKVIKNFEGEKALSMTPEYELYAAVVTTGLNASFYEAGDQRLKRIVALMEKCDPVFVAKLAVYARNNMYLRSVPLVLAVELAKLNTGDSLVSKTVNGIVKRADEITELLAYYQFANARTGTKKLNKLSKQVQKGLGAAFNQFDEYQFAKYNRSTEVKLKDALFLVHPKAKDVAQQEIFTKIATDTLETPYTWETELSKLGQTKFADEGEKLRAFALKWEELIESKALGYMALMRNLRNILEANVSGRHMQLVCAYLSNETAVKNAKQMPFRFLAAYREIKALNHPFASVILDALEVATIHSAASIKGFDFETSVVIACDVSGSMQKPISARSKILLYDIGLVLGMMMQSKCKNVISGMFGDRWKVINMPQRSILANVQEYYRREGEVGYSTNGFLVLNDLIAQRRVVDKVMFFTDVQLYNSAGTHYSMIDSWKTYKKIAPNAKLYLFDLAGYGQQPLNILRDDVHLIAGWSDKIFDMLHALEHSKSELAEINAIEL